MNKLRVLVAAFVVATLSLTVTAKSGTRAGGNSKQTTTNQGSPVTVETDRFSGATTITLKPQKVLDSPNHLLTVSAETKLSDKPQVGLSELDERAEMEFTSLSKSGIDFGDEELHFLVDGKRVKIGAFAESPASRNDSTQRSDLRVKSRLTTTLSLEQVRQIARGKQVEMRLGSIETTFSPGLLNLLSEFVQRYDQAKNKAQP